MRFTLEERQLLNYLKRKIFELKDLCRHYDDGDIDRLNYELQVGLLLDDMLKAIEDSEAESR